VQTVDFFTPVVDDPFAYGGDRRRQRALGRVRDGRAPLTALSIARVSERDFPLEWAARDRAGREPPKPRTRRALRAAGGHSCARPRRSSSGYAVTGLVDPERMLTNAGGRAGQALRADQAARDGRDRDGAQGRRRPRGRGRGRHALDVAASTARPPRSRSRATAHTARDDITGFGLVGHAAAIARRRAGLTLEIELKRAASFLPGALDASPTGTQAGGLKSNRAEFEPMVEYGGRAEEARRVLLYDPQTSGGLLLLVPEPRDGRAHREARGRARRGRARSAGPRLIVVRS
jgi:selenide,water dikinase